MTDMGYPDEVSYIVNCCGCDSNVLILVKEPGLGADWFESEESRQLALDGWSYTPTDYAICPGCDSAGVGR